MTEAQNKSGLSEFASIRYIGPENTEFTQTSGGFISLKIEPDEFYSRINLYRIFPFSKQNEYISIRDSEGKEIGIIRSLKQFPAETIELFEVELNRRYFSPIISKVDSIKEEFGYSYWNVQTDAGPKRFTVQRGSNNVIPITDQRILLIDVDGNRFEIPDYRKLDEKHVKIVETIL